MAKKAVAGLLFHSRVIDMLQGSGSGHRFILAYHRVISEGREDLSFIQPGMFVTEDTFEMHVRHLLAHYDVVPLDDLLTRKGGRACAITFDDGWRDNYLAAYPILRAHRVPATIFLATNLVGTTRWPWPDRICLYIHRASPAAVAASLQAACRSETGHAVDSAALPDEPFAAAEEVLRRLKRLEHALLERVVSRIDADFERLDSILHDRRPWLTWKEAEEMSAHAISFGSHTENHVILTRVPAAIARAEVQNSARAISEKLGRPVTAFCYPNGEYSAETVRIVAAAGYRCAVTTKSGPLQGGEDPFELPRILLHDDISSTVPLLACSLAGWSGFRRAVPAGLGKPRG